MTLATTTGRPSGLVDVIDASSFGDVCDDVAGHLNAQMGRLLDLTIWLVSTDPRDWQGEGLWTPQQYLAWRCGVGPALASNLVRAAERADDLPLGIDALRRGELSFDQLMPIVRAVPAWADGQVVSLAKRLTVSQIRRLVRTTDWSWEPGSAGESAPDVGLTSGSDGGSAATADTGGDANRVHFGNGHDGRWFLHADLDADLGALVETALHEARDAVFARENEGGEDRPAGPGPRATTDVDGLVELAQRSLDAVGGAARRNRYRVNLYLELDGTMHTDRGVPLPQSISRHLTCDGRIDPLFARSGRPVSVGRSQRTIPDRTRRAVLRRDDHRCQVPGCSAGRGLDLHHIRHWADGGTTDTANLLTVCARHHRMHHIGRLGIAGDADDPASLRFHDARGRPILPSGANPHPPNGPPPPIRGCYEHPLGERLDGRWVTFVDPERARADRRGHSAGNSPTPTSRSDVA